MKRQSFPAEGELTEEKLVNVHAHSRDSSAHETTSARAVGSVRRKTLHVVDTNAFGRKKQYPPGNRYGKTGTSEWGGKAPQRRENLQRKSRRMPTHIRGIRRLTKRH